MLSGPVIAFVSLLLWAAFHFAGKGQPVWLMWLFVGSLGMIVPAMFVGTVADNYLVAIKSRQSGQDVR